MTTDVNEVDDRAEPQPSDIQRASHSHIPRDARTHRGWIGAEGQSNYVHAASGGQFIGVWVNVPKTARRVRVPMAITLTIDTSGSMGGDKIRRAREAAQAFVGRLADGDIVAVHAFSTTARQLVGPTELNRTNRMRITGAIAELQAGGATNIQDALNLALNSAHRAPHTHPVRRVIIISDGRATAGITNPQQLGAIVARHAKSDIQVTAMGVGLDYDEHTLNLLAMRSHGRLYHLADARELQGTLSSEIDRLQSTMATRAGVVLVPAPGVRFLGVQNADFSWTAGHSIRVPLGVLFAGQSRELLVRFRITDRNALGERAIASARLHYRDPADGLVARIQETVVRGTVTNDPTLVARHTNARTQGIVAMHETSKMAQQARDDLEKGRFDKADASLARVERRLANAAKKAKTKPQRQRLAAMSSRISRSRRSVKAAAKAPPAARSAAQRAGSLELNDAGMDAIGF
jgi:Ca-activated chloride channel family protein